ncbi:substrate-binding domain-containing protein [Chitinophaga polysaccharea]|uniref:substrate-binding domain-containing protein n=1 Tax=Chitinophaga polysaccharea TaxID=1293035 RepID=UPI001C8D4580|nr:substrate-binding domain-containing protein [Chitinophaga polysaccharea]
MSKITEPELTTIDNPAMEMGEIVAKHLLQQLNGNIPVATNNKILLESKLIVRASSLRIKS